MADVEIRMAGVAFAMISTVIDSAINMQINLFASSTTMAAVLVTVLDCLAIYAFTLPLRKKTGQAEFTVMLFATVLIVLVVLELIGGAK